MKRNVIHTILFACIVAMVFAVRAAHAVPHEENHTRTYLVRCELPFHVAQAMARQFEINTRGVRQVLRDERAQRFMDFVNTIPPETDFKPDMIIVVSVEGSHAQMWILKDECVLDIMMLRWDFFQKAMTLIDSEAL